MKAPTQPQSIDETLDYRTMLVINAGLDMANPLDYTQGLNVTKFKNKSSDYPADSRG